MHHKWRAAPARVQRRRQSAAKINAEKSIYKGAYTPVFMATLYTTAKKQKHVSTDRWTGKDVVGACAESLSRVQLFVTPWTTACQLPLSTVFSRQEYWSEQSIPIPSPEDIPDPGIKPETPALQADSLPAEPSGKPLKMWYIYTKKYYSDIGKTRTK